MNVNGTDANSLLAAQLASQQRQPAQDLAGQSQRNQTLQIEEAGQRQAAQAPQTSAGIRAVDPEDSGRTASNRRDPPSDAQADARAASDQSGGQTPQRGSVVNIIA